MKIFFILVSFLLLFVSCDVKKENEMKKIDIPLKLVSKKQEVDLVKPKELIEQQKKSLYSPDGVISNVNSFKARLTRKKSSFQKEIDDLDVSNMTLAEAKSYFNKYKEKSRTIAFKISTKCRNFESGNYFFKNLYEYYKDKPYLITIGMYWGNFAMRHAKSDASEKIFDIAINDTLELNDKSLYASIANVMNYKVEALNMSGDFNKSLQAAKEFYDFVIKNKNFIENPEVNEAVSYSYYIQELYNNEQYDEALNLIGKYKKDGVEFADDFYPKIENFKKKTKFKTRYSLGYGDLSN